MGLMVPAAIASRVPASSTHRPYTRQSRTPSNESAAAIAPAESSVQISTAGATGSTASGITTMARSGGYT